MSKLDDEHYDAWERENKRAAQEKHEEKYWSEIEDGLCPPTPVTAKPAGKGEPPAWANDFQKLLEDFRKKGWVK